MAKRGGKLGDAYVDIHASTDNLDADLKRAKADTEQAASEMGDAVDRHVSKRWQEASSKVTGFVGSVTAALGVAALAGRVGYSLGSMIEKWVRARDVAEEFRQSLRGREIDDLRKEIDALNGSVTSVSANVFDFGARFTDWAGLTVEASRSARIAAIEQEIAAKRAIEVQKRQVELANRLAQAERERSLAAAARRSDIDAQNEQLEIDQLQGIKKIEAERERAKRETLKKIQSEEDYLARLRLEYQLALIDKKYQADIDKARDAEQEKQRLAEDSARKQAEALASALTGALNQVLKQQATSQNVAGPIQELGNRIIAEIQSLKFRGGM